MSKIIKAAELKVLVTNETHTVIPASPGKGSGVAAGGATILDGSNLIGDARRQADQIVTRAEEQAQRILQQANEEVENILLKAKEEGYAQGYAEGLVEGEEKARQEANDLLMLLEAIVEEGVRLRAAGLEALEEDFLKLSLLLADKIMRKSVEDDIAWLEPVIKDALRSLGTANEIVVLLNPMDYSLIKECEDDLLLGTKAKLTFERDSTISQGSCLIESENGLIDARLEKRLGKLGRHLMEVLYNENN